METTQNSHHLEFAAQLTDRLPRNIAPYTDVVLENDLAGRAILAMLWQQREHLRIHLLSPNPAPNHILAFQAGIAAARNAPSIQRVSNDQLESIAADSPHLIWALTTDRTSITGRRTLQSRDQSATYTPYFEGLRELDGQVPNQQNPAHELYLRDVIGNHVRFLNFFGDRFNPLDLYQRSRYPSWFRSSQEFNSAFPPLQHITTDSAASVLDTKEFSGTIQLSPSHVRKNHRAQVDFSPVLASLEDSACDITLELNNDYIQPSATGALAIEVHLNQKLQARFDIASTAAHLKLPLRSIKHNSNLKVSVRALRDNPKVSWSNASQTFVKLQIHPMNTHPAISMSSRVKLWLKRSLTLRLRGK